jgi:hypothetical protein
MNSPFFWDIKSAACFMLVSCLTYSSILKLEAILTSEMSVDFQGTTRRHIPEDRTLHCVLKTPPL